MWCLQACYPAYAQSDLQGYLDKANHYLMMGQPQKAEQSLMRALRQNNQSLEAYLQLADLYLSQQYFAEAERLLNQALEFSTLSRAPQLWLRVGLLHRDLGRSAQANSAYQQAEAFGQDSIEVLERVAGYYFLVGDNARARVVNMRLNQLEANSQNPQPAAN